jgi:hydrogenase-1 operon protein HyaE
MMARVASRHGLARLDVASFEVFAAAAGDRVVLFAEDPVRVPESWDALVLLPELVASAAGRLAAGMLDIESARLLAVRHGIRSFPALLFLRGGGHVGVIEGLRDWSAYLRECAAMLDKPAGRAPLALHAIGAGPACH